MQHTASPRRRRARPTRPPGVRQKSVHQNGARQNTTRQDGALVWRSPERHLWVATGDGEYAGMTQFDRRVGYTATGPTAAPLGRYRSLGEAKAAIESA